jgi:hypothetical protein
MSALVLGRRGPALSAGMEQAPSVAAAVAVDRA